MQSLGRFWTLVLLVAIHLNTTGIAAAADFTIPESYLGYGEVRKLSISPDNKRVLILGSRAAVVELARAYEVYTYTIPTSRYVLDGAWSADGSYIAVTDGLDTTVVSAHTYQPIPRFESLPGGVSNLAYSFDGKYLAVSIAKEVQLWSMEDGRLLRTWPLASPALSLEFAREVNVLVAGGRTTRVWNADTGEHIRDFRHPKDSPVDEEDYQGYGSRLTYASISPDAARIVTGAYEYTVGGYKSEKSYSSSSGIFFWKLDNGELEGRGGRAEERVTFSPDGQYILYAGGYFAHAAASGSAKYVDAEQLFPVEALYAQASSLSPDGSIAILWSKNYSSTEVTVIDLTSRRTLYSIPDIPGDTISGNGRYLLVRRLNGGLSLYDRITNLTIDAPIKIADDYRFALSFNGERVAALDSAYTVRVFDVPSGSLLNSFQLDGHVEMAFSRDGARLLTYSVVSSALWDISSGSKICDYGPGATRLRFNSDETRVLKGGGHSVEMLDAETAATLWRLDMPTDSVRHVAWSPDDREVLVTVYVPTEQKQKLVIVDSQYGQIVREIGEPRGYSYLGWSEYTLDGDHIVAKDENSAYLLLDASSGEIINSYSMGIFYSYRQTLLPDGRLLSAGSGSRIWNLDIGLAVEGEGTFEGEGVVTEGTFEGVQEGTIVEGEGAARDGEGLVEEGDGGSLEGEGLVEGIIEGGEGGTEGIADGDEEGVSEGETDGEVDGEGSNDGALEGEGEGVLMTVHSADYDQNGLVSLHELLRVIQFHNRGAYRCSAITGSEDGYELASPGEVLDSRTCHTHSSDYAPPTGHIDLSEVLRLIQLYQHGSFYPCSESPDGFCLDLP